MTRIIEHEQQSPYVVDEDEFEEQGGAVAICRCGLSDDYPFCDGSHNSTKDEDDGELYKYEGDTDAGERQVVDRITYGD